ncbi:MAG: hypothetical protein KGO01_19995 [Burkholderiales bacterium]|nr:hypothetical protein [Burkholderiales bacterium]
MPLLAFRSVVVALLGWAALQAAFLTYQAHQFLNEPYAMVGAVVLAAATVALLLSGVLAAVGRKFHKPLLGVAVIAPAFLVFGMTAIGNVSAWHAFSQLACTKGVGLCFPQAEAFLLALGLAAAAGGVFAMYARKRAAGGA